MKTIRTKLHIMALLLTVLVIMTAGCASEEEAGGSAVSGFD